MQSHSHRGIAKLNSEMDLQEQVRMQDTYERLTKIIEDVSNLGVFPSLVWVWTWDVALSTLRDFEDDEEFHVNLTEEDVFKFFWRDADKNGFSLEYGTEDLYEAVREWMIDEDVVSYKEDLEPDDE
jgi:hypothetical protein